jgi:outer membrane protein OmpA-like peptidoglycan-associated protein/tetratricopeptide (TPR) repeat protein
MKYFYIFLISAFSFQSFAQKIQLILRDANREYRNFRYLDAIPFYQDVLNRDSNHILSLTNLADCYFKLKDYKNAEKIYSKLTTKKKSLDTKVYLNYAEVLAANKNYTEASVQYLKYAKFNTKDSRSKKFAEAYKNIAPFFADSSSYKITYLAINTSLSDFSPAFYKTGIAFCSNRVLKTKFLSRVYGYDNSAFLDIYYADSSKLKPFKITKDDSLEIRKRQKNKYFNDDDTYITSNDSKTLGSFSYNYIDSTGLDDKANRLVKKMSMKVNSKYHEGPMAFTQSFDTLYFTRNNYYKGKAQKTADRIFNLKIYRSLFTDSLAHHVVPININSNKYSIGHPTITPDGKKVYFTSDMPGGNGGTDIYVSNLNSDGTFTKPKNLGSPINTEGNEMFPYISAENILFFASTGHPGLGGLDIFSLDLTDKNAEITNLGYPINTSFDDFGFIVKNEGSFGFFSSNRKRGIGDDDIYIFNYTNKRNVNLKITVKSASDSSTITTASNKFYKTSSNEILFDSLTKNGVYETLLNQKTHRNTDFTFVANAKGFYQDSLNLSKSLFDFVNGRNIDTIIYLKKQIFIDFCGSVSYKKSGKPIDSAKVYFYDLKSHKLDSTQTNKNGKFCIRVQPESIYVVKSEKANHFHDCYRVHIPALKQSTLVTTDVPLQPVKIGLNALFELKHLLYDYDKAYIRPDAALILDNLVEILEEYPTTIIEIDSHSDSRGNDLHNKILSGSRAASAADYIIKRGINAIRISAKGFGETRLLNRCKNGVKCSDLEHQVNRRTEVRVVGFLTHAQMKKWHIENKLPIHKFAHSFSFTECDEIPIKINLVKE